MFSASGINLTTLIKRYILQGLIAYIIRLEAATSRLEDLAVANTIDFRQAHAVNQSSTAAPSSKEQAPQFNSAVFASEAPTSAAEELPVIEEEKSPVVLDYQKLVKDFVDPWVTKSQQVGKVVGEQVYSICEMALMARPWQYRIYFKYNWCFFKSC